MFAACVYIQIAQQFYTETVFGKHALYYATKKTVGTIWLGQDAGRRLFALTTGIARIAIINAIGHLVAGDANLIRVDDNNVVAAIYMWSKTGFVLSTKQFGYFCAKTT